MEKLIINAAITGMVPTKAENPYVPITPDEILADVGRCRDAGASVVHVHARDEKGAPTYRREVYREIITRIREDFPDIIISGSTSGRVFGELGKRVQSLDLGNGHRPDLGSLTLGSMNFPGQASVNEPEIICSLAKAMKERGVVPEWELFDLGMTDYAAYLIKKGVLERPYYANIILGSLGTLSATPYNLMVMVRSLPEGTTWSVGGIGRFQFRANSWAVVTGGHVRVGLEDSLYYDEKKTALATNPGLVERVANLARAAGREIAEPHEARSIIGLRQCEHAGAPRA